MNGHGKSDSPIVPGKSSNNARRRAAEGMEERGLAKRNSLGDATSRTQGRTQRVSSALERVRQAARRDRRQRFTALLHHVYAVERLRTAYEALEPKAAPGVDGVTWHQYGEELERNLQDLSDRLKRGAYRALPVRRAHIPKADGRKRPIGVPTLEDKIVQRSVAEVLSAVYEQDFVGFSYGFRLGRGQHDALDALAVGLETRWVNWVLDADIRGFFDTLNHEWLIRFVEHRIGDRRIVRLIRKWLRAGVLEEDGRRIRQQEGTVQGGSISPLLANIYLHYVFDLWIQQWRRKRAEGTVIVVRYADDFVVGFRYRRDAERFLAELRDRFARFGLALHPDKTRLIAFGRFAAENRRRRGLGKPETFDFLGFTHISGRDRHGRFRLRRKTMRQRMQRKLREVKAVLYRRMHAPIPEQGRYLAAVMRGHVRYYGVPLNRDSLRAFRWALTYTWAWTLRRRSHKARFPWSRMKLLTRRWIPNVRISHPHPSERLAARLKAGAV
jgi:group II intron reverse transcriptase/maturase